MKIERAEVVPVFEPITITIESLDELKWFIAIANTDTATATTQGKPVGVKLSDSAYVEQMALWNALKPFRELVND